MDGESTNKKKNLFLGKTFPGNGKNGYNKTNTATL